MFAAPKTDTKVQKIIADGVSVKTQADTKYCIRMGRKQRTQPWHMYFEALTNSELQYWLCRFVLEVRNGNQCV